MSEICVTYSKDSLNGSTLGVVALVCAKYIFFSTAIPGRKNTPNPYQAKTFERIFANNIVDFNEARPFSI